MAAAPGYTLPMYPEPEHVFNKRGTQLSFVVDDYKYTNGTVGFLVLYCSVLQQLVCVTGCEWLESAPYRTISVKDAMADLPYIENGWNTTEMTYDSEPISHFQRMIRGGK